MTAHAKAYVITWSEGSQPEVVFSQERAKAIANMLDGKVTIKQVNQPTMRRLERMVADGIATYPDGCRTELDGGCSHGFKNWLSILGLV